MPRALYATRKSKVAPTKFFAPSRESSVSDSAPPDFVAFHELEQLVRSLGEELAGFRRRALAAEGRLKALEVANGPTDLFSHERRSEERRVGKECRYRWSRDT